MIRRSSISCPRYVVVIGFLLALAATRPCHGNNDAVRMSEENDERIRRMLDEAKPKEIGISHDNIGEERHLEGPEGEEEEEAEEEEKGDKEEEEEANQGGEVEEEENQGEVEEEENLGEEEEEKEEENLGGEEEEEEEKEEENLGEEEEEESLDGEEKEEEENLAGEEEEEESLDGEEEEEEESLDGEEEEVEENLGGEEKEEENQGGEVEEEENLGVEVEVEENLDSGEKVGGGGDAVEKTTEGGGEKSPADKDESTSGTENASVAEASWDHDYAEPAVGKYVVGFLVLIGIIVYLKCFRKSGGGMVSSSHRSHAKGKYQTIGTDDVDGDGDDWGWDDSNTDPGDVELAGSSSSLRSMPSPSGLSLKQRSPSIERRDLVKSPNVSRNKGLHLPPAQQMRSLAQPSLQPTSQMNAQSQRITSLGGAPAAVKKTVPRKPKEDDIFASMGLSAQPKFQPAVRSAPTSSGSAGGWGSLAAPVSSSADTGGDWENDDDLDDLFDD